MILKSKRKISLSDMVPTRKKKIRKSLALPTVPPPPKAEIEHTEVPSKMKKNEALLREIWSDESAPPSFFVEPTKTSESAHVPLPSSAINFLENEKIKKSTARELKSFAVIAILVAAIFQTANIVASSLDAKHSVMSFAVQGLSNLKEAQDLAAQNDLNGARDSLESAHKNFVSAQDDLKNLGAFVNTALSLTGKGKSAQSVVDAGRAIAEAGIDLGKFTTIANQIKFGSDGVTAPDGTYQTLNAAQLYLKKASSEMLRAQSDFNDIDSAVLPDDVRTQFAQYKELLQTSADGLEQVSNGLSFFQAFLSPGQKNILVLFQNNNELRPTGGFIGTYGYFKLDNGKIISQKISSIYNLDGQLKDYIAPPGPYQIMTDRWALRDSNYFADFKTSAQKASVFYEKEGMETPDAVVAVTPDIFIDLLNVTGQVDMPKYGLTLTAENFRDSVQANTSDSESENPKQFLSDFAPVLLERISALPEGERKNLLPVLFDSLAKKNILVYDRNPLVQNKIESYNWGGRLADSDRDYLAVYNTNIGGKKTDIHIDQSLEVKSEIQNDGSIVNTLTYNRTHNLNVNESDKNIDYVRFFVPHGSELLSAKGFNPKPFQPSDASKFSSSPARYSIDSDLKMMDTQTRIDAATSTAITKEAGKTVFANWIETAPGETSTVTLKYKLPFKASASRKYSFILQKQPGNNPIDVSYEFIPKYPVLWYTPLDLKITGSALQYHGTLSSDLFIGAVLDNQK